VIPLLTAAVRANAEWCSAVHESHGHRSVWGSSLWTTPGPALPYYPNAVTLTPRADLPDDLPAAAFKDSFADQDLSDRGWKTLLEGWWLARPVGAAGSAPVPDEVTDLDEWETAWADGRKPETPLFRPELRRRGVRFWGWRKEGLLVAGAVTNPVPGAVGFSNVFGRAGGPDWAAAVEGLAGRFPGLPLVGWEALPLPPGAEAGPFRVLGPLRVWTRTGS